MMITIEIQRKRKCSAFNNNIVIFQLVNKFDYQNVLGKIFSNFFLAPINVLRTRLNKLGGRVLL